MFKWFKVSIIEILCGSEPIVKGLSNQLLVPARIIAAAWRSDFPGSTKQRSTSETLFPKTDFLQNTVHALKWVTMSLALQDIFVGMP
jgi:hypothetical protein